MIVIVIGTVLGSQSINSVYSYNDYTTLNLQPDIKNHKNSFFNTYCKWFESRRNNKTKNQFERSFSKDQFLDYNNNKQKKLISFFTSSDDERISLERSVEKPGFQALGCRDDLRARGDS